VGKSEPVRDLTHPKKAQPIFGHSGLALDLDLPVCNMSCHLKQTSKGNKKCRRNQSRENGFRIRQKRLAASDKGSKDTKTATTKQAGLSTSLLSP
jgi:hypothetical protein